MRVVIVSQYYPPEPVPIPHALAQGLAERGHDVRVVTAYPNYPEGVLAGGFRQSWVRHEDDGKVRVRRVPIFISHSRNPVGRLINYASFAVSSLTAGRFVRDADVVYVYATQMTAAFGPSWWQRVRKTPFVLHVQDLWPESISGSSMVVGGARKRVVDALLTPWLHRMYRQAAATIALGPTMSAMLVERGVPAHRIHAVYNWADETQVDSPSADRIDDEPVLKSLTVMYAGNIGELQDLETVVRAAALVKDLDRFRIEILGTGVAESRLKALVVELDVLNITFRGRVPSDQMHAQYARSDFQIVSLKSLPIFRATIPSKFQSSLANGIPVITTVAGDVRDLVDEAGVGLTSRPGVPEDLAQAFRTAYAMSTRDRRQMGLRARDFYRNSMSRTSGIDRIEAILLTAATDATTNGRQ